MDLFKTKSVIIEFDDNTRQAIRRKALLTSTTFQNTHRVVEGQTLESIAKLVYHDEGYGVMLGDVNNVYNPFELEVGSLLLVPEITEVSYELTKEE